MAFFFSVVPEYRRLIHFRLGRYMGIRGPGLVFPIIPIIDMVVRVDLREIFFELEPQTCITKDNAPVAIDMFVYMRVEQPELSVLKVQDFAGAARGIAMTTLRAVVGDISLDDVLAKRDQINQVMRAKLDEVTERWGVKVTAVEIREIMPPRDVQEAMTRQMSAERSRRAVVTEAEGNRQAAIQVAEGQKQAAILTAEGERQAAILKAEGNRQAAILNAEGFSQALQKVYEVAQGVDAKTMSLQYLDMLKVMAAGPSTRWIVPVELTSFLQNFTQAAGDANKPA
ncbi:MAG TPA: SPFH domain-containing protein [Dehalococcoidia bacterium]|nr:SPFH domain-containing protein [Dehalococcoidia bacterium]